MVPISVPLVVYNVVFLLAPSGTLTKKLVENVGARRHGDGGGLYLVVDPSAARW